MLYETLILSTLHGSAAKLRDKLLRHYSPRDLCTLPKSTLHLYGFSQCAATLINAPNETWLKETLKWLARPKHAIITRHDTRYPPLLKQIHDPPFILYVAGDVNALSHPQLALVGSRKATPMGRELANELALAFIHMGFGITSGLALGIDACVHQATIQAKGIGVAVLGSGLCHCYPRQNSTLAQEIADNSGAVISEYPLNQAPRRHHFPRRNRIISGLSAGTVIVEAGLKSGSLITAHLATAQNRPVFAVPGAIKNDCMAGNNALLREGAIPLTTPSQVLEEVKSLVLYSVNERETTADTPPAKLDSTQSLLLECVGFEPTAKDTVIRRSGLVPSEASKTLSQLELLGLVIHLPSGYQKR